MVGFNPSTGGIDLVSQPGDIPLDSSHDSGPDCNHSCPNCCPPEQEDEGSCLGVAITVLLIIAAIGVFFAVAYMAGPHN